MGADQTLDSLHTMLGSAVALGLVGRRLLSCDSGAKLSHELVAESLDRGLVVDTDGRRALNAHLPEATRDAVDRPGVRNALRGHDPSPQRAGRAELGNDQLGQSLILVVAPAEEAVVEVSFLDSMAFFSADE